MEPGDYVRLPGGGWGRITSIQNTSNRARVVPMGRTFGNIPTNEPFGRAAAQAVFHPVQNLELLPQEYQGQELASFKTMREAQAEVA